MNKVGLPRKLRRPVTARKARPTNQDRAQTKKIYRETDSIQIQNETTETVNYDTDEERRFSTEKNLSDDDTVKENMFYLILNSKQLSDLITSNLCSKEHVSHGFSTMLNFYTEFISKKKVSME